MEALAVVRALDAPDVETRLGGAGALGRAAAAGARGAGRAARRDARVGSARLCAAARLRGRAARPLRAPGAGSRARRSRAAPAAPHRRGVRRGPDHVDEGAALVPGRDGRGRGASGWRSGAAPDRARARARGARGGCAVARGGRNARDRRGRGRRGAARDGVAVRDAARACALESGAVARAPGGR